MAAKLNVLNGASTTAQVDYALSTAESYFNQYTPSQKAAFKGKAKTDLTTLAAILDNYNNGLVGPGHCSENSTSG